MCLIDYFPCNYSRCHTQYFSTPGKVQGGLSSWRTTFILSYLWAPNVVHEEARVKLKPCTGHQWRLVLIDWRVIRLTGKDSWALEPIFQSWCQVKKTEIKFVLVLLWHDIINLLCLVKFWWFSSIFIYLLASSAHTWTWLQDNTPEKFAGLLELQGYLVLQHWVKGSALFFMLL